MVPWYSQEWWIINSANMSRDVSFPGIPFGKRLQFANLKPWPNRNNGFSHWKQWMSIVMWLFTRRYSMSDAALLDHHTWFILIRDPGNSPNDTNPNSCHGTHEGIDPLRISHIIWLFIPYVCICMYIYTWNLEKAGITAWKFIYAWRGGRAINQPAGKNAFLANSVAQKS